MLLAVQSPGVNLSQRVIIIIISIIIIIIITHLELLPALAAMVGPGWNLAGPVTEPPPRPPYEGLPALPRPPPLTPP